MRRSFVNRAAADRFPSPPRCGKLVAAALFAAVLAACGGGSTGSAGPAGANGTNGTNGTNGQNSSATVNLGSNSATPSAANTAAWAALAPQVTITSVSISSPPVVKRSEEHTSELQSLRH